MDKATLLTADYLDIIFDQRNKTYGGYELRRHYSRRTTRALLSIVGGVGALACFSFITISKGPKANTYAHTDTMKVTIFDKPPVDPPKPRPDFHPPAAPKTAMHLPPVITNEPIKPEEAPKPNKDLADAQPGPANHDGDPSDITPPAAGTGKDPGTGVVPREEKKEMPPATWVQQMPRFIGDMDAYIGSHLHYPDLARESGFSGMVLIRFVVNEDGSVSDAVVMRSVGGGCDEEALRMVRGMPRWKPGRQNGTAVKVYFVLPIKFEIKD